MTRKLTCIVCPKGCPIQAEIENGEVISVMGHTCPRGKQYANDECTHPMRTVTSTARTSDGGVIPVKTNGNIPKEKIFEVMDEINKISVESPVKCGDILLENVLDTGVNIVACRDM